VRESVVRTMNCLGDAREESEGAHAALTRLRAMVGGSADGAIRLSLAKIAVGKSIASRVGDSKVDQFVPFYSMLNRGRSGRSPAAVANGDRALAAADPRFPPSSTAAHCPKRPRRRTSCAADAGQDRARRRPPGPCQRDLRSTSESCSMTRMG
jgi:hypothetical protein